MDAIGYRCARLGEREGTMICPKCKREIAGLGRWCWHCREYTEDMLAARKARSEAPTDTRSENERKADARPVVEALGWTVHDTEQGYRPKECACGRKIPGGGSTRVPLGFPDWVVQGHGVIAFVEWKTEKNQQTEPQRAFERRCVADGVPYMVVRNTAEVTDWLQSLNHEPRTAA